MKITIIIEGGDIGLKEFTTALDRLDASITSLPDRIAAAQSGAISAADLDAATARTNALADKVDAIDAATAPAETAPVVAGETPVPTF